MRGFLGARDGAAWAAGIAAAIAPVLLGLTAALNTTTFEPLAWTTIAYALARAVILDDRRALVWGGAVAGVAMEAKYALPLWLIALALGILATPARGLFARRELWLGLGLATLFTLPSVMWQTAHGWPFIELLRNAAVKDVAVPLPAFAVNQLFLVNPLLAPLWVAGLIAPFVRRDLAAVRFIAIAFALTAVVVVLSHGKDYYLAAAYPPLFAIGAVALAGVVRNRAVGAAYFMVALTVSALIAPLVLPILAPRTLVAYEQTLHIQQQAQEHSDIGSVLPPLFADELGWHDFVRQVAAAYDAVPPALRAHTGILVDNYGEASALDVYGFTYGLPPALSGHNQYYLWGERGQHVETLVRVQRDVEKLRPYCTRMSVAGTTDSPFARPLEQGKSIAICEGLHPALSKIWPQLKEII